MLWMRRQREFDFFDDSNVYELDLSYQRTCNARSAFRNVQERAKDRERAVIFPYSGQHGATHFSPSKENQAMYLFVFGFTSRWLVRVA